jgi:membrane protein required for colicin V production
MFRGMIKSFFSLVTWVGAAYLAILLQPYVKDLLEPHIQSEKALLATSSAGTYVVLLIVLAITNAKIMTLFRHVKGGVIDRSLGFAFGFFRGALIMILVFFSIDLTSKMLLQGDEKDGYGPGWFKEAQTYNLLKVATGATMAFLPEDVPERLTAYINKFKDESIAKLEEGFVGTPELDKKDGKKSLSREQLLSIKKITTAMPKDKLADIYSKHKGRLASLTEEEKMSIFKELVTSFNKELNKGNVKMPKDLTEADIRGLNKALMKDEDILLENTGYKDRNIKQLDRLIDALEEKE